MASLQRSDETFRRMGSSGLVWQDQLFSGDLNGLKKGEEGVDVRVLRPSQSVGTIGMMHRDQSNGGRPFHAGRVGRGLDPPSPKVSGCGFFGLFGKRATAKKPKKSKK
ncbi:hypothetical protein J5N97_006272 [Dioscorea zingiberensis]|uniref:Uncharacterized protein n=1 Tax=Dioscorea zingiberensis TaxID=325984 RepID=A0A9D5HTH5_9LILI|nr:hypothetical protein J5N97_006272 [Dioscorea zingiberensis]